MLRKNTAGQFIHFQGVDSSTGGIKSGVTWTVRRCIDGTFAAATGTVTEDGTTGWYKLALSQADTNGNDLGFNFTGTGAVPQTVNVLTTAADPTDSVRLGLTALPNAAAGAVGGLPLAVDTSGRVDVLKVNGTSQTARDLGASVLISSGTGTGQLDVTSGVIKANLVQILATALTETAGQIAAGFKQFFNIASPTSTMNTITGVTTVTNLTNAPTAGDLTATMKASVTTAATAATPTAAAVTGAVGSVTGNVGGNVTGSVGSVVGAVASVTGNVGGNVTGSVGSVATGGITRASLAADTGLQCIRSNTAQAGSGTTITLDASASATNSFYNNTLLLITGGTGAGQARFITAYVGATKVATVATWATSPDNTSTFAIMPFDAVAGASAPTAAQVATAVWTDLLASSDFSTASSIGKLLKDDIDAAVSSRMATYTQPTGFLAATFPGTVASTTNITAGTITTTTNLTNLPSIPSNWLTAAGIAASALNGKGDWNIGKTGYALSAAGVQAIWDVLTSALTTVGSIGKLLVDNVNATISSRSTYAGGAVASVTAGVTVTTNNDKTGYALTSTYDAAKTASQVGDVMKVSSGTGANQISLASGLVTVGTNNDKTGYTASTVSDKTGYALTAAYDPAKTAAQAGDAMALTSGERTTLAASIWNALTSGITTSGSIGKRIIDYLTGDIFARLGAPAGASVSADIAAAKVDTAAIKTKTDQFVFTVANQVDSNALTGGGGLNAAGVRAAIGLVSANLDTQLDALPTNAELATALGTADDAVLAQVALVKAQTDLIPASPAAVGDIPTANENADALLKRDFTAIGSEPALKSVWSAMRFIVNKFSTTAHAGEVTVYREDGVTEAYTKPVVTSSSAEPIVEG